MILVFKAIWLVRYLGQLFNIIILCKLFFTFHRPKAHHATYKWCLQIMVCSCSMSSNYAWLRLIIFCSCVKTKPRFSPSSGRSCVKNGRLLCFLKIFIKKQTWWLNDKTIIELGYRKILWFVSVLQTNYLPQLNNWSAHHWQITIFCNNRVQ